MGEIIGYILSYAVLIGIGYWIYKKIKYRKYKKSVFDINERINNLKKNLNEDNKQIYKNIYNENNEIKYRIIPEYRKKEYIMTYNELKFYKVLKEWANINNYTIFTQVVLYEIIEPNTKQKYGSKYNSLFNRIKSKSIDFTICEENGKILKCIELDDETHYRKSRIKRDKFVNEVFQEAGLQLIHIKRANYYNLEELKNILG